MSPPATGQSPRKKIGHKPGFGRIPVSYGWVPVRTRLYVAHRLAGVWKCDDFGEGHHVHRKFEGAQPWARHLHRQYRLQQHDQQTREHDPHCDTGRQSEAIPAFGDCFTATYGTVSGAGTFAEGSSVTVIATPNGSHSLVNWTQNAKVVSTSVSYMFTMPSANATLTAHFK